MAWVSLVDSGLMYEFAETGQQGDVHASLGADSIVTAAGTSGTANWSLDFGSAAPLVRITVVAYSNAGPYGPPAGFYWQDEHDNDYGIPNQADPQTEFLPSEFVIELFPGNPLLYAAPQEWVGTELETYSFLIEVEVDDPDPPDPPGPDTGYNCACDDDYPRTTLEQMRNRLATRLGFATQVAMGVLPPGMAPLLDDFTRNAQEMLYRRYSVFRMERFYAWDMQPGVRFYDFDANADACPKHMDPRMVTWVGISQGDLSWRPLVCGIDPVMYGSPGAGIPSHYEIRQCIEVWPAPVDDTWKLRIKGHFGLLPLDADSDETTIDPEAIFLQALANAKAHYGQPDAENYAAQAAGYVHSLVAGSHHTRRYVPGASRATAPWVRPVPVGGWPEDSQ